MMHCNINEIGFAVMVSCVSHSNVSLILRSIYTKMFFSISHIPINAALSIENKALGQKLFENGLKY